jgi:hypothetical protein
MSSSYKNGYVSQLINNYKCLLDTISQLYEIQGKSCVYVVSVMLINFVFTRFVTAINEFLN